MTEKYTPNNEINANLFQEFQKRALQEYGEVSSLFHKCVVGVGDNQVIFGTYKFNFSPFNGIYKYKSEEKQTFKSALWVFENDAQKGFYNPKRPKNYEYKTEECLLGDCEFVIPKKLGLMSEINQEQIKKFTV